MCRLLASVFNVPPSSGSAVRHSTPSTVSKPSSRSVDHLPRTKTCVEDEKRPPQPLSHEHLCRALAPLLANWPAAFGGFEERRAENLAQIVGVKRELLVSRRRLFSPEALRRVARHPLDLDRVVEERVEGLEFSVLRRGRQAALLEQLEDALAAEWVDLRERRVRAEPLDKSLDPCGALLGGIA